jgi:hypothetical protein
MKEVTIFIRIIPVQMASAIFSFIFSSGIEVCYKYLIRYTLTTVLNIPRIGNITLLYNEEMFLVCIGSGLEVIKLTE